MTSKRTNLGPLTTTFTYPSSCSVVVEQCSGCSNGWQAQTCSDNAFNTQGVQDNTECWPPRSNAGISTGVALLGWGFYSPGIYCPAGYMTACSATGGVDGGFTFQYPLEPSETAIGCCPTGYTCTLGQWQTCQAAYSTGSFPAVFCSAGSSNGFSYQTVPATVTTSSGSTMEVIKVSRFTVNAPLIQLNYKATDMPVSASASTTASAATTTSATNTPPTKSSSSPSAASSNLGLSAGAKAGIGVGVGVAGLIVIAAIVWFLVRGRRRSKANALSDAPGAIPELPATSIVAELSSTNAMSEADSGKQSDARTAMISELGPSD